jgi:hypothetical protein
MLPVWPVFRVPRLLMLSGSHNATTASVPAVAILTPISVSQTTIALTEDLCPTTGGPRGSTVSPFQNLMVPSVPVVAK